MYILKTCICAQKYLEFCTLNLFTNSVTSNNTAEIPTNTHTKCTYINYGTVQKNFALCRECLMDICISSYIANQWQVLLGYGEEN